MKNISSLLKNFKYFLCKMLTITIFSGKIMYKYNEILNIKANRGEFIIIWKI